MPMTKHNKKGHSGREDSPGPVPLRDRYSSDDDDDPVPRKGSSCSKMSKQGKNKKTPVAAAPGAGLSSHNKPAELFRKDLISAMKLADTDVLHEADYVVISDPWRQEWEKGVQVPVNQEEIPHNSIRELRSRDKVGDFKIPVRKYLHEKSDDTYVAGQHELTGMQELAERIVRYDLDDQDVTWLELVNEDREEMGLQLINEWNLERMIEELENQCYVKTNAVKKTEEGLGIEYDEDVACDVCRLLESEDTNEMVFCDGCDICVHQACYGIQTIPEGSWLCRICALGIKPMCLLCPKRGGAMKSTRSGTKWAHVSCALWIPEVIIGDSEKMEPVTKISNIPPSRWALICCLCKERVGACIQCSVKQCKTAFHVTCGFAHNLDMKTILDDSDELDGIHFRAYCPKHTKKRSSSDSESPKKEGEEDDEVDENDEAELAKQRFEKLQQLEEEFFKLVNIEDIAVKFYIPEEAVDIVAEYWKLKRKVNNNKPLITPKMEEEDEMQRQQKDSLSARMKMFVHLRQDLERARNLCYMISRREKTKRSLLKLKESVFRSQICVLTDSVLNLSAREAESVRQEYHFSSIYSGHGGASELCSKLPRENLFTLENLKTPKDLLESGAECQGKAGKTSATSSKLPVRSRLHSGVKVSRKKNNNKSESSTQVSSVASEEKEAQHHGDNVFSMGSLGLVSCDSLIDSSDDDEDIDVGMPLPRTDSAHMSRLGKVKPSGQDGSQTNAGSTEQSPKKFVPGDLKKRLTSILQAKTMQQQKQSKSSSMAEVVPELSKRLHVDTNHSDSEVFTSDTNTDLFSPITEPQRNLFDQFTVKPQLPPASSPEAKGEQPPRKLHKKLKKRKRSSSAHKHKRNRRSSPPELSSSSSVSTRPDFLSPTTVNGSSTEADHSRTPLASPDTGEPSTKLQPSGHSAHSSRQKKKKCRRSRESLSQEDVLRSPLSSPGVKSPSSPQRLTPAKIKDGDVNVSCVKSELVERATNGSSAKEEESKCPVGSKLRLKKQANSPVKGVVSYQVVTESDTKVSASNTDLTKDSNTDLTKDSNTDLTKDSNLFERLLDVKSEEVKDERSSDTSKGYKSQVDHRQRKSQAKTETDVASVKSEVEGEDYLLHPRRGRRQRRQRSFVTASKEEEEEANSSDENFVPSSSASKMFKFERVRRPRQARLTKRTDPDMVEAPDSDDFTDSSVSPRKPSECDGRRVRLTPFKNRPELELLLDSSQLVVGEPLKRKITASLTHILHRGNGLKTQSTLDKFVKRTESSENVFARTEQGNTQRLSKRNSVSVIGRAELLPLKNSSTTINSDNVPSKELLPTSPVSPVKVSTEHRSLFGALSSPRNCLSTYRIPRRSDSEAKAKGGEVDHRGEGGDAVFGDSEKLSSSPRVVRQLSFEDMSCEVGAECAPGELAEDRLDGSRSYRSQSPASSDASSVSTRILSVALQELTPTRRLTRSHIEESPSPASRLRRRDGAVLKPPQLKLS